ncbi:uncharacterized protein LOC105844212 isoform X1 [Hydra vulgaris]|uniref:uncharacterized protein LOC105844212 isoform X1 n=1 Tax=Hydra vulgaris TaxID=6087 RepID=UPI0032EA1643
MLAHVRLYKMCCGNNNGNSSNFALKELTQIELTTSLELINLRKEFIVTRGLILGTLNVLKKEYIVSFNLKTISYSEGLKNVLHLTLGNNCDVYGDRNPGVWFDKDGSGKLVICVAVNDNRNYCNSTNPLGLNQWYKIKIYQGFMNGSYFLTVCIDDVHIYSVENTKPKDFENMKVYASNLWEDAQNAFISELIIENIVNGKAEHINHRNEFILTRGLVLGTMTTLKKEYIVSFNLKPISYSKGLRNVLHLTLGNNCKVYGDRNPGIWFHEDGSGKLVICSAISNNRNYCIETDPLILGQWHSIRIYQSLLDSKYFFAVDLNSVNVYKVENSVAKDFENVEVYGSNNWDDAQNATVSELFISNGKAEYLVGNNPTPLVQGKILARIPMLEKEHLISFDLYLNTIQSSCTSIIHFTYDNYDGNRVPGLYYCDDFGLQIADPYSGVDVGVSLYILKLNSWSNLEVSLFLEGSFYVYRIKINGEILFFKINDKAEDFYNVEVYASNLFNSAQNGSIKNLFVINGRSSIGVQPIIFYPKDHINNKKEFTIKAGLFLGTLDVLKKVYTVSFNLKPLSYSNGSKSVLHLTLGGNSKTLGDRSPGIWFLEDGSGRLAIYSAIDNNYFVITNPLPLGQWSNIVICQYLQGDIYLFTIDLNKDSILKVQNFNARDFENIKVYASNPWDDAQDGLISDLLIANGKPEYLVGNKITPLVMGKLIAEIPDLNEEYLISFDINPNQFLSGKRSVVHFADKNNIGSYENSPLSIWFTEDSRLAIRAPISDDWTFYSNLIGTNMWSNIDLCQILKGSDYIYIIRINGEMVYSQFITQPKSFNNVKVYATDPWGDSQDGSIKSLFVINGISNSEIQPIVILPTDYINHQEEFTPTKGFLLGTLNVMAKTYTLSFNLKPLNYSYGWKSVLHLTLGSSSEAYGYRNPGVFFDDDGSGKLVIYSAISGNNKYSIKTDQLTLGQWSNIKIYQFLQDSKYWFAVDLNKVNILRVENSDVRDFKTVKVYVSNPWDAAQNSSLSDLLIINGKAEYLVGSIITPLLKGKIVAIIPILDKEYLVSFDVNPNKFVAGFYNVIHLTIGSDNFDYGDRVPGVWFNNDGKGGLYIAAPINGNKNYIFFTKPIDLNRWTNIKVGQFFNGSFYIYTVKVNDELISSEINYMPKSFVNVTVYASDPWYNAQDGSIKNLFVINGNISGEMQPVVLPAVLYLSPDVSNMSLLPASSKYKTIAAILVPILVVFFILSATTIFRIIKKKSKHQSVKNLDSFILNGFNSQHNINGKELSTDIWEIFPENIILDKKIGEGAFGTVFVAKVNTEILAQNKNHRSLLHLVSRKDFTNVAVKFLKEINLMKEIGFHKNIVNMIGCSTMKKPLCLIVEFMENGDLLHFLRKRRAKTMASQNLSSEVVLNEVLLDENEIIMPDDLLSFAWQVASGMEFLSCTKLVHRDLAARNILVGAEKNVKISDFGLSRKVNDELNYISRKNRRLPVKWMSVEAIFDQMFTSYSDVWAYGVVLFEIVTLGGTPYPTISNRELLTLLKSGYRMDRPDNCSEFIYDIMLHCWNEDPLMRPTFTELREHLDSIISQGGCYFNFEIDEKNAYYNIASFNSLPFETVEFPLSEVTVNNEPVL